MNAQINSFSDTEIKYGMVIDLNEGKATNCLCPDRQYRGHECKHMKAMNTEIDRASRFLLAVRKVREMEYQWKANREMAFSGL